jgi:glycosyltransferase involved in cell wall biosynthesis
VIRVLHVVATGDRRGAEVFAGDLVGALQGTVEQRVAVMRTNGSVAVPYRAPVDVVGSYGWQVPGIRLDTAAVRALRRLASDWEPDVVQVHGGEPLKHALFARIAAPVVYRKIGLAAARATRPLFRLGHTRLMQRTARIVAVADSVRREAIETFGAPEDRVVTIPNAVDVTRLFDGASPEGLRADLGIPPSAPVVLSLGALTWEKDPLTHVAVAERTLSRLPEAHHVIAGDGPLKASAIRAAHEAGLSGRVHLVGSRGDAASLLRLADVLLLASRTEGMPGCVIEGGLLGTPTVAFDVAGVREVISDGKTGLLASPGDVDGLAEWLSRLLTDGETRARLGRGAAERAKSFTIDRVAPRYASLYEEVAL